LEAYKIANEIGFFHDNIKKTNKRMGYDNSFSAEETLLMGLILLAIAFGVRKGIIQKKSPEPDKTADNKKDEERP
jgi:hypothetical protein